MRVPGTQPSPRWTGPSSFLCRIPANDQGEVSLKLVQLRRRPRRRSSRAPDSRNGHIERVFLEALPCAGVRLSDFTPPSGALSRHKNRFLPPFTPGMTIDAARPECAPTRLRHLNG